MLVVTLFTTLTAASPQAAPISDPCPAHRHIAYAHGWLDPGAEPLERPAEVGDALVWLRDPRAARCDIATAFTVAHRVAVTLADPRLDASRDWALTVLLDLQRDWRDAFLDAPAGSARRPQIALAQVRLVTQLLPYRWRYTADTRARIYAWERGWGPPRADYGVWLWTLGVWLDDDRT